MLCLSQVRFKKNNFRKIKFKNIVTRYPLGLNCSDGNILALKCLVV